MGLSVSRHRQRVGRNDKCPCGTGLKFKKCCLQRWRADPLSVESKPQAIDYGEDPVRWVICDESGTKLFVDKQGRILVFTARELAGEVSQLDLFANQDPNEINVAGVGPTKWLSLQEKFPFLEVSNIETATALIQERIDYQQQVLDDAAKS